MDANHTPSLEYTLLGRGLFFNSEVSSFQYGREKRNLAYDAFISTKFKSPAMKKS